MSRRVLVAGIGNIFLGDDGFGVAVAQQLAERRLPAGTRVVDFGIRGVHLAYELLDGYDDLILIDAVPMAGEAPGTIAVIEPDPSGTVSVPRSAEAIDAHSMNPVVVLRTLAALGGSVGRTYVVGCQPDSCEEGIGLSPVVAAAVNVATDVCVELAVELVQPVGKESGR
jgi:hydrogenase maturation protease